MIEAINLILTIEVIILILLFVFIIVSFIKDKDKLAENLGKTLFVWIIVMILTIIWYAYESFK